MNKNVQQFIATSLCAFLLISTIGTAIYIFANKPFEKHKPLMRKIFRESYVGQIAIIIDDWGYNKESCEILKDIDIPLAISILPDLPYSEFVAEIAHQNNKEVMLHLPLEPHRFTEHYPENYVIMTSMNENQVKENIDNFLKTVPYAKGANNHMGSKATQDKDFMKLILRHLKYKKMFFVDSVVSPDSACKEAAKEVSIPFTRRDVFLDNLSNEEYIRNQIKKLAELAKKQGYALGIAHNRPTTLKVIQQESQKLKDQGFEFVNVKTLTNY